MAYYGFRIQRQRLFLCRSYYFHFFHAVAPQLVRRKFYPLLASISGTRNRTRESSIRQVRFNTFIVVGVSEKDKLRIVVHTQCAVTPDRDSYLSFHVVSELIDQRLFPCFWEKVKAHTCGMSLGSIFPIEYHLHFCCVSMSETQFFVLARRD